MPLAAAGWRRRRAAAITLASQLIVATPACAPATEKKPATTQESKSATTEKVISGHATVIDGDGVEIGGTKIRLFGIDAPEIDQYCNRSDGTRWRCGQYATVELDRAVAGHEVACTVRDKDRYGRLVCTCRVAGADLAEAQVASGFAVAYRQFTRDYIDEEDEAREAKLGVWSGRFEMPWDWRNRAANAQSRR